MGDDLLLQEVMQPIFCELIGGLGIKKCKECEMVLLLLSATQNGRRLWQGSQVVHGDGD